MRKSVISIKDVAARAGVSPATVSNVLNNKPTVDPELAARVREAAETLSYRADRAASQLRAGKARVVAVLVPDLNNPFFTALIASVEASLRADGYDTIVASSNGDPAEERSRLLTLLAWRPAGLVVVPCDDRFESRDLVARAGVPLVLVDRVPLDCDADAVTVDNRAAGEMAARLVLDSGHRDVVVAASTLAIQNIRERCAGIEAAFRGRGLPEPSLMEVGLNFETATERLGALLRQDKPPTAFLALTNFGTLGVLATLHQWGLRVPHDVSVVGFDDYSWMRAVSPPLTAVSQPVEALGREAWSRLKARIEGDASPNRRLELSCELVVRESTAAVERPATAEKAA